MIKLEQVSFSYKNMPMRFHLSIQAGEKVAVIGKSGAGKSTLLNLIAGFVLAQSGEIYLNSQKHNRTFPYERPVSMLFQENNLFEHLTLWQNIALAIRSNLKLTPLEQEQLMAVATQVGLPAHLHQYPQQLSGGQKQRGAIARSLLLHRPILLLDEPFSALDPILRTEMLQLIHQVCQDKNLTLLMVSHQVNEIIPFVDRIITIENGQVLE